ncbi:RHS repeat-associated core domain-containing protein [Dyadobacter sediminis]|uniref:RHS repeat-associated core domain-containing protein n=1 Tax=Dyadobacter sediminis TaxID=1493691 RepID=A0A5R9K8B7_9BACT|nr:RHS repeat-associated core domain-containing protein [Dyadobacter sediminis]TLU90302.1 RHS repeat-associated core domain-containing protein [Dyadobacter sediminis]GGC06677.1 hypothetical protein GCM10011325_36890 [Dyadobacter sediminis]
MQRIFTILILTLAAISGHFAKAQNNTRPTVPVPNGFEVNSYTGNLYHSRTDLKIPGRGLTIDITFSYNASRRNKDWGMGKGWTFTYNMAYRTDTAGFWIERADGRRDLFRKSGANYIAPKGIYDALKEYESGKFYVQTKEGLRYYFENATHRKLTKMQDANGNQLNFAYTDTLLRQLSNSSGHAVKFAWQEGRLAEISDNTCEPGRKITYAYDSLGNTNKVVNPIGDFVQYYSDSTARITGFTDEGGNNMSIFYNANGAVSKVVSCATSHSFNYATRQLKTFVAEQLNGQNVVTTYQFDDQGRVISKKGNCCGFNLDYGYDENNNVAKLADGNKKQTAYEYDSNGNVIKETDAAGQVATYTYNLTYNKVTSFTDKNGNKTTFQYDSKGNITQIGKPLDFTEKSTYDTNGNRLTYVNANNNTTRYEYDENGNLIKVTDPEGGITSYTYDCYGNKLTETDPENNTTSFSYNALNQLIKTTNVLGHVTTYTYNKLGLQSAVTNALGKTTKYTYDGLGRRIGTIMPMGNSTQTEYDGQGNVISETDGNGNVTAYTYNNRRQPLSITDALGNSIFYEYDEAGNKLSETDKNGNITRFEYNDLYQLTKVTDALGGVTSYSYDAMGNRTAELDANGNTTAFAYDALQRLVKVTDALGYSEEYTYDKVGNRLTVRDKNGHITATTYDKLNRKKTITDALKGIVTLSYDKNGNVLSEKDALSRTTKYTYDALNQQATITNPLNEVTTYTYDAAGNEKTATSPNGNVVTSTYDDNGQLISTSDKAGAIAAFTYDKNGNVISENDGNGNATLSQYDAAGQLVKTTFPNETAFQFFYDANGNKIKEIDQKGNATWFAFDKLNRTTEITDPLSNTSRFVYDAKGNLIQIMDAKGNTTSYTYDVRNKPVKQVYADGSSRNFTYDANGQLTEKTNGSGIKIQYKYDALNRLTERIYPENITDKLDYDAAGFLVKAANSNAVISFQYDAAGKLLKEDNDGKATVYSYNSTNRTKSVDYPGGIKLLRQMDSRDRLTEIKESGTTLVSFQYDGADRLKKKSFRNGVNTDYSYDKMDNLKSISATPASVLDIRYDYDKSDKRILTERLHKPARSEKYTYDNNYQLNQFFQGKVTDGELTPSITNQYTYDALGNRATSKEGAVEKTYSVNHVNQYTAITTNNINAPPAYDKNGNLISDGTNTYAYDFENRLISIQAGRAKVTYKYDALGRRVSRTQSGTETRYYYDLDNLIQEVTGNNVKSYVYGEEIDHILYAKAGDSEYFYETDDLNSVQSVTDASGALLEYYTYDPFGTPHVFNASDKELAASTFNNFLFTGRQYEFQFKTYHYRNREMNPNLGRFAQRDPLEFTDGLNNYAYVGNNVVNATDPLGLVNWGGVSNAMPGIILSSGGATYGIIISTTGLGATIGLPLAAISGYNLFKNAGDLITAINSPEETTCSLPPSPSGEASSCKAFYNHSSIVPKMGWVFRYNAIEACSTTGNSEKIKKIRESLQKQYSNDFPNDGKKFSSEEHYQKHKQAYEEAGCKNKPAPPIAWYMVDLLPGSFIPGFIPNVIEIFGPCD